MTERRTYRAADMPETKDTPEWCSSSGEPFNPEFHQTCDNCGAPGMSDSDGFQMQSDGRIFCLRCDAEAVLVAGDPHHG